MVHVNDELWSACSGRIDRCQSNQKATCSTCVPMMTARGTSTQFPVPTWEIESKNSERDGVNIWTRKLFSNLLSVFGSLSVIATHQNWYPIKVGVVRTLKTQNWQIYEMLGVVSVFLVRLKKRRSKEQKANLISYPIT